MSELGKKGAKARLENYRDMTPERRAAVAEKARKTRRETISRRAQASKPHTNKRAERLAAKEERRKTRQENRRLLKPSSALEPCVGMHAASASCCIVDGICRSAE